MAFPKHRQQSVCKPRLEPKHPFGEEGKRKYESMFPPGSRDIRDLPIARYIGDELVHQNLPSHPRPKSTSAFTSIAPFPKPRPRPRRPTPKPRSRTSSASSTQSRYSGDATMIPPLMSLDIERDSEPRPMSDPSPSSSRDGAVRPPAPSEDHAKHAQTDEDYRRVIEPLLPKTITWEDVGDHQLLHDIIICGDAHYDDILSMVRRANETCTAVAFGFVLKDVKDRRLAKLNSLKSAEYDTLAAKNTELAAELSEKDQEIADLRNRLEEKNASLALMEQRSGALEQQIATHKEESRARQLQVGQCTQHSDILESKCKALQVELDVAVRTVGLMTKSGSKEAQTEIRHTASASAEPDLTTHASTWPEDVKLRVLDELHEL